MLVSPSEVVKPVSLFLKGRKVRLESVVVAKRAVGSSEI